MGSPHREARIRGFSKRREKEWGREKGGFSLIEGRGERNAFYSKARRASGVSYSKSRRKKKVRGKRKKRE